MSLRARSIGHQSATSRLSRSASLPDSGLAATFLVSNYPSHVVESDPALAQVYMPWMTNMINRDGGWADETHDGGM